MPARLTQEQFINKANTKHNNYYNYSLVNYIKAQTKVKIICPKHGEFEQQPNNHLFGQGCIKCMGDNVRKARTNSIETFINNAKKIHNDKYDYSLVNYKTGKDKVIIICYKHGEFLQTPSAHSSLSMKQGCPYCKISKGEDEVEKYLIKHNIKYIREYRINDCINPKTNKKLPFDFYLPNYNIVIEYHGEQHYKKTGHFEKRAGGLEELKYRDNIKKQYCIINNIIYLDISYLNLNNIENILNDKL
jgi:hypothetical protein